MRQNRNPHGSNPNRVTNVAVAIANMTRTTKTNKKVSPQQAEKDLVDQIVRMEQSHHSQMPGANRQERRLMARKVRQAAKKKDTK